MLNTILKYNENINDINSQMKACSLHVSVRRTVTDLRAAGRWSTLTTDIVHIYGK